MTTKTVNEPEPCERLKALIRAFQFDWSGVCYLERTGESGSKCLQTLFLTILSNNALSNEQENNNSEGKCERHGEGSDHSPLPRSEVSPSEVLLLRFGRQYRDNCVVDHRIRSDERIRAIGLGHQRMDEFRSKHDGSRT